MANQAGKGGGPAPKGIAGGVGGLLLLGGLAVAGNNALFNVDGGHRAIKYTRLGGVSKEIYSEGTDGRSGSSELRMVANLLTSRNAFQDPMVRNPNRLRCASKATQRCFFDWNEGFADGQHHLPCALQATS